MVGPELGAFLGAFVLGVSGKVYGRASGRPAALLVVPGMLLLVVPGMLLLVPGSLGFRSFLALMDDHVIRGIEAAFSMAVIATALVAGLLIADVVAHEQSRKR